MNLPRSQYLLATLIALLTARGLAPGACDPWRSWVVFKEFARATAEHPDPGVSVQIESLDSEDDVRLYFIRQVLEPEGNRLEPVGGIICEFWYPSPDKPATNWETWSFDFPTFDRFVDAVEQHPPFADLLVQRPRASDIYWEDA